NAHPQRKGKVSVVHNGIIENHPELRASLPPTPAFSSDTDSEVLAHLVETHYDQQRGPKRDLHLAVRESLMGARGACALCVVHDHRPGDLVVAGQGSPLLIGPTSDAEGDPETFVASDAAALLAYTRVVVDLEDGATAALHANGLVEVVDVE